MASTPRPLDLSLDLIRAAHAIPVPDDPNALTVMTDDELRPGLEEIVAGREGGAVWVFAYGSLMWNPGFPYAEAAPARLRGYHRAFCIYSVHYRGTQTRPGLVLGLDRGGTCDGIAYRLVPEKAAATLAYLRARELIYAVYREALVPVSIHATERSGSAAYAETREAFAITFIAEPHHPAYAGRPRLARQLAMIRGARGTGGTNIEYLANTLCHLQKLGIRERPLERLMTAIGKFATSPASGANAARASSLQRSWREKPAPRPRTVRDHRMSHRAKIAELRGQTKS